MNNNDEITSSYNYRYDGLRFSKTVDGSTKYFTYNGGNITSELTSQGTYNYYRGLSLIGMANPQQEKLYYVQNYKGDIIGLKDGIRNPVQSYSYDPFGNLATDTEKLSFEAMWAQETSQVYNPFGYCGEYFDLSSGFYYLRGRYYDPATERFITEDPMKDGGNWYAYCGNDPVNFIDPSGFLAQGQTLSYGNGSASDIKKLQQTLKDKRLYNGKIDGSFGPQTKTAVNAYKDKYLPGGNKGDNRGVVGATTWNSLGLKLSSSSSPTSSGFKSLDPAYSNDPKINNQTNNSGGTLQIGIGGSIGAGAGVGVGVEVGITLSRSDWISFYASGSGTGTTPEIGLGASFTWTNAQDVDDLSGSSVIAGGGYGPVAGGSMFGKNYTGGNVQLLKYTDLSPVSPSVYVGGSYTVQTPSLRDVYNRVKDWFN